jgi:hypothetical protein
MHEAKNVTNLTMETMEIDAGKKSELLREFHKVNVDQYTTHFDLDHLSREIKQRRGLKAPPPSAPRKA